MNAAETAPEVWLVDLAAAAPALFELEARCPRLSADDEARCAQAADEGERRDRRASYIALRLVIERAFGPRWRTVAYRLTGAGKPSLPGAPGAFNLAHSGGFALVGIAARGPLGVDIERARRVTMSAARRADLERAAAALAPRAPLPDDAMDRFLQAWTRLEAMGKAEGSGVGVILEAVRETSPGASAQSGPDAFKNAMPPLDVHDIVLGSGLFGAVALASGSPEPAVRRLPAEAEAILKALGLAPD